MIDWKALQAAGRLDQTCPRCGRIEAAGEYCTSCNLRPMAPHWHTPKLSEGQSAALVAARAARLENPG